MKELFETVATLGAQPLGPTEIPEDRKKSNGPHRGHLESIDTKNFKEKLQIFKDMFAKSQQQFQ